MEMLKWGIYPALSHSGAGQVSAAVAQLKWIPQKNKRWFWSKEACFLRGLVSSPPGNTTARWP